MVPDDLMRGLLIHGLPGALREAAKLKSGDLDNYPTLREYAMDYLHAKSDWTGTFRDQDAMDGSYLDWKGGKGKG